MQLSGGAGPARGNGRDAADAGAAPPLGRAAREAVGPAVGDPADHDEIDELGTAVSALLRTWHCLTRRGAERTGLTAWRWPP